MIASTMKTLGKCLLLALLAAVSRNSNAIGYIALGYLNAYVKPLAVRGAMGST